MPTRQITLQLSLLALATCAWAAAPFATVSATEPFELNGNRVPTAGVPSWPVAAGDVIATTAGTATVVFRDGSRVEIAKASKARIERAGTKSVLRLLQGSGKYSLASAPSLNLFVLDQPAAANPATRGIISTNAAARARLAVEDLSDGGNVNNNCNDNGKGQGDCKPHPSPSK